MSDKEFLEWIRDRIVHVYGESPNTDFVLRLGDIAQALQSGEPVVDGNTSDGYHTFNELYDFRKAYNAAFFNELHANNKCSVHKSWRHHDNELCFGGGWFIVVAVLPTGQISNHYEAKDWGLFAIPEAEKALVEFDGHTGKDVVERLNGYTLQPVAPERLESLLHTVQDALHDAYQNADLVCCGKSMMDCCGSPVPEWSEADQKIMDVLSPIQRELSDLLSAGKGGE